ncbi:MAG: dihydrodipicolinate synthase family protein [Candidatus Acidiferrales bacterium]
MARLSLRGIFPPLTTPFAASERVDLAALETNLERYNQTLLAGYVVLGSTGEAVFLREKEKLAILEAARAAAAPEKTLIAGTGAESTAETIELTRRAATFGYHAALVRTPSYFKPQMTPAALERHYRAVADASPIPILIYSVPQFTGLAVEAPLVARLSEHPNIVGLKDSSGDLRQLGEILQAAPVDFVVLVGSATTLYASLALGAHGGILAAACVLPELCVEIYEAHRRGDHERANAAQLRLNAPALSVTSRFGIAGLKYAMELRGYVGGPVRAPLEPLEAMAQAELDRLFAAVEAAD